MNGADYPMAPPGRAVYLDYNATTPPDPRVVDAMEPYLRRLFGNAASPHAFGAAAHDAVERAREQLAALIGARAQEVVFTSGATESDNLAVLGTAQRQAQPGHIVSTTVEHKAVLDPLDVLRRRGTHVSLVEPDSTGRVAPETVAAALRDDTFLVSVLGANNEVGTLAPIAEIGQVCRAAGVLFHCDAAQLVGKVPVDVDELGVDLLSMSAHKMYGPKGVGALFVRRGTRLAPIMHGGGHERGLRSGTVNVPAVVGFGTAAAIARHEMSADIERGERLRTVLLDRLCHAFPDVELNGHPTERLPGTLNVRLPGIDAESLQLATPQVALSSGSACTSATPEPSHVLRAIGRTWAEAQECIRFGFGRFTTVDDIDDAVELLAAGAARLMKAAR